MRIDVSRVCMETWPRVTEYACRIEESPARFGKMHRDSSKRFDHSIPRCDTPPPKGSGRDGIELTEAHTRGSQRSTACAARRSSSCRPFGTLGLRILIPQAPAHDSCGLAHANEGSPGEQVVRIFAWSFPSDLLLRHRDWIRSIRSDTN